MRTIAAISSLVLLSVGVLIPCRVAAQDESTTSLGSAVEAFNELASEDAIGKHQPPLTEDEVIASIRGWIRDQAPPVSDHVYAIYQKIAETRRLPEGATLDYITAWSGFGGYNFTVWWVDLDIMTDERPGYTYRIRDRKIRSRPVSQIEAHVLKEERWQQGTPLADAKTVLESAKELAVKEGKLLFVHFGAPWCGWCKRLESLLSADEMVRIFSKQYITVKIDLERMTNGKEVQKNMAANHGGGIPWYAILDASGKTLATSDGPQGNTGYPLRAEEIAHFVKVIRSTAKDLKPEHIGRIEALVRKRADEIQSRRKVSS